MERRPRAHAAFPRKLLRCGRHMSAFNTIGGAFAAWMVLTVRAVHLAVAATAHARASGVQRLRVRVLVRGQHISEDHRAKAGAQAGSSSSTSIKADGRGKVGQWQDQE